MKTQKRRPLVTRTAFGVSCFIKSLAVEMLQSVRLWGYFETNELNLEQSMEVGWLPTSRYLVLKMRLFAPYQMKLDGAVAKFMDAADDVPCVFVYIIK